MKLTYLPIWGFARSRQLKVRAPGIHPRRESIRLAGQLGTLYGAALAAFAFSMAASQEGCRRQSAPDEAAPVPQAVSLPAVPVPTECPWVGEGADSAGNPWRTVDKIGLRALLLAGRYTDLTRCVEGAERSFEADWHNELWPIDAISAFDTADPRVAPAIEAWAKVAPKSYAPILARAQHHLARAWFFRGGKLAADTSSQRMSAMLQELPPVTAALDAARLLAPRAVAVERLAIQAAALTGDRDAGQAALSRAERLCPACFQIRVVALLNSTPHWGGSYETMAGIAKAAEAHLAENPRLGQLAGYQETDRCDELQRQGRLDEALAACMRATALGENCDFLAQRARVRLARNEDTLALADAEQALKLRPQDRQALELRVYALGALHRWREHADAQLLLAQLDPAHPGLTEQLSGAASALVLAAEELDLAGQSAEISAIRQLALGLDPKTRAFDDWERRAGKRQADATLAAQELALREHPDDIEVFRRVDGTLAGLGDFQRVVGMWNGFIARHPEDGQAVFERAGALQHLGWRAQAESDVRRACRLGCPEACNVSQRLAQQRNGKAESR